MKKFKRNWCLLLSGVLLFAVLTSCGDGDPVDSDEDSSAETTDGVSDSTSGDASESTNDTADVGEEWEFDKDNHWHVTADGEKTDVAEHSITEGYCSVCDIEIYGYDGEVWVQKYNENGDICLSITYGADGNVTKIVYEYDSEGNLSAEKTYENGEFVGEERFECTQSRVEA